MALPAITTQLYTFPPNGPYDTGLTVKTAITINASGTSNLVTNDAADGDTDFTTANANLVLNPNAKENSATRLFVHRSDVSVTTGPLYIDIGWVTATNVGTDAETFTLQEKASVVIPADCKLYSNTFAPMLNGRVIDVLAGASASVTDVNTVSSRGEIVVSVSFAG
tara:strand:+ start:156 stop:653 length:498 start_codon:yes stop_codon:yes gene_type:complete